MTSPLLLISEDPSTCWQSQPKTSAFSNSYHLGNISQLVTEKSFATNTEHLSKHVATPLLWLIKIDLSCVFDRRESTSSAAPTKFEVQVMAQFDSHNSQVWRVSWNITSTLLASSGDDGCVRLWKGQASARSASLHSTTNSNKSLKHQILFHSIIDINCENFVMLKEQFSLNKQFPHILLTLRAS